MPVTRRSMLGLLSASTFVLSVPGLAGQRGRLADSSPALEFPQGVASGDPQPQAVMLWTRAVPAAAAHIPAEANIPLLLQVSSVEDFSAPLLQSEIHTSADSDYTVRSYVEGLQPDTSYFFRFLGGGGSVSRTGRTRTAPAPGQERAVNLAFASCQSYEDGFYGSWARMLADDAAAPEEERIDFVLHLGDFIYERLWRTRRDGTAHARKVPPLPDGHDTEKNSYAVSLADYRHLYRTYLSDPHLQEARARWPFVCTWDDHEFSNDNYQSFSTYGGVSRPQSGRKQDANQAWFEFIPCVLSELENQPARDFERRPLTGDEESRNRAAIDSLRIYRQLRWGRYLDLVITDSRSYRSPHCLPHGLAAELGLPLNTVKLVAIADGGREHNGGEPPDYLPYGTGNVPNPAKNNPPGTLLGREQREWFTRALESSTARWKLWGNALPLIPLRLDLSALPFSPYEDSIFSVDSWAGYPHEQALLMRHLEERSITGVVSLSGDHHMHGAGTVSWSATEADARPVCVDFTTAGISSTPLFEDLAVVARDNHPDFQPIVYREENGLVTPVWNMSMLQGVLAAYTYGKTGLQAISDWLGPNRANPGLKYVDTTANGYGLARFERDGMRVDFITMEGIRSDFERPPPVRRRTRITLPLWQPGEAPELPEPEFDGGAPFPFEPHAV